MAAVDSKLRFLQAGRDILAASGELGVNAVAKKTGLNKVLLYRYFEDWNGYLHAWPTSSIFGRTSGSSSSSGLEAGLWNDAASAASWVLRTYQGRLRADEVLLTIMATERSRSSPLRRRIDDEQEAEGTLILQALFRRWPEVPRDRARHLRRDDGRTQPPCAARPCEPLVQQPRHYSGRYLGNTDARDRNAFAAAPGLGEN